MHGICMHHMYASYCTYSRLLFQYIFAPFELSRRCEYVLHIVCTHVYLPWSTYIHTYIHAYIHTYIHTYIHIYTHEQTQTHIPIFISLVSCLTLRPYFQYLYTYIPSCIHIKTQTHIPIFISLVSCLTQRPYLQVIYAYIPSYIHIQTHTHTYLHFLGVVHDTAPIFSIPLYIHTFIHTHTNTQTHIPICISLVSCLTLRPYFSNSVLPKNPKSLHKDLHAIVVALSCLSCVYVYVCVCVCHDVNIHTHESLHKDLHAIVVALSC
jgi:hypothetical protein